ncbi:exodeoxyribonuclease VII [Acinetobacter baumannii A424]|nr:exodeoxyribonuclease VII [Acinetobacter baumannii A424]
MHRVMFHLLTMTGHSMKLLESQESPDIDNLMKIVEESIGAYKACKSRIEAVQQALDETFKE